MNLIKPKNVEVKGKVFVISKVPATVGRKIAAVYAQTLISRLEDYDKNEAAMYLLLAYAGIPNENPSLPPMALSNPALINNHVTDWEMLIALENEMVEYNVSFLPPGGLSAFLKNITQLVQALSTKTSMDSLAQSFQKVTQPSTNSEASIA